MPMVEWRGKPTLPTKVTNFVSWASEKENKDGPYSLGSLEHPLKSSGTHQVKKLQPLLFDFPLAAELAPTIGDDLTIHSAPDEGSGYDLTLNYQAANPSSIGTIYLAKTKYNSTSTFLRLGIDGNVKLYTYNDKIDFGAWEVTFSFFDRHNSIWWENECQLPERCGKFGLCEGSQCVACPSPKGLLGSSKSCEPEKLTSCRENSFCYYKVEGVDHFLSKYTSGIAVKENDCGKVYFGLQVFGVLFTTRTHQGVGLLMI
ncbi:unnamed protein product [Prunus armeniaca]